MINNGMPILVEKRKFGIGRGSRLVLGPVYLVAARIFTFSALCCKENWVVVALWVVVWLVLVILPLLDEKDACLGSGVGLEGITVKSNDSENAALVRNIAANLLIGRIIEAPLRENDCHSSTSAEKLDIALDEKNIATDTLLRFAILRAKFIPGEKLSFFDLTCERRICHYYIKLEIGVRWVYLELAQFLVALVICVDPCLVFRHGVPTAKVERVEVKNIRVPVTSYEV